MPTENCISTLPGGNGSLFCSGMTHILQHMDYLNLTCSIRVLSSKHDKHDYSVSLGKAMNWLGVLMKLCCAV